MAYFDRKRQLYKVLDSINESTVKDYEIIIVDDASTAKHQLDINELREHSTGQVRLLVVDPNKKTWLNSCIPYNIAFARASGDKIIIQPPVYHPFYAKNLQLQGQPIVQWSLT